MTSYNFSLGDNVCYQSKCCTIYRLRVVNSQSAYFLKDIQNDLFYDNILESDVSSCTVKQIGDIKWNDFNYTGDNALASTWIFNNIIRHIKATNVSWGSNQTNTTYTFKASGNTWTKDKSN